MHFEFRARQGEAPFPRNPTYSMGIEMGKLCLQFLIYITFQSHSPS